MRSAHADRDTEEGMDRCRDAGTAGVLTEVQTVVRTEVRTVVQMKVHTEVQTEVQPEYRQRYSRSTERDTDMALLRSPHANFYMTKHV